jgi:hypothetical protein
MKSNAFAGYGMSAASPCSKQMSTPAFSAFAFAMPTKVRLISSPIIRHRVSLTSSMAR